MTTLRTLRSLTPWLLLSMLAVACGDSSGGTTRTPTRLTSETVGSSGGTLTASGGVQVQVPSGAVSSDVTIVVSALEGVRAPRGTASVGTPLRLEPAGTTFDKPVSVTIPIEPSSLMDGGTLDDVVVLRAEQDSDVFVPLPTRRAASGNAVVAVTEHFSDFLPVIIVSANNPFGSCGDSMCVASEGETCDTCPGDCGVCVGAGECGNGVCEVNSEEYCGSCEFDCGACASGVCGDGILDAAETCDTGFTLGTPIEQCLCDDGNPCTDDVQVAGSPSLCNVMCTHTPRTGFGVDSCDDGVACTLDIISQFDALTCTMTCLNPVMDLSTWSAFHCDDMDACTLDVAEGYVPATCATSTCSHAPIAGCIPVCGDGLVGGSETCDDGNSTNGDGCDALCSIEGSYTCPPSGGPCWDCGDGVLQALELCDEGPARDDVGCEGTCTFIAPNYTCPVFGQACVFSPPCGNGTLDAAELCDDGDMVSGDGCSATCQLEGGYVCPIPGMPCYMGLCGDGQIQGIEACDDANATPGDGCAGDCLLIEVGYLCAMPGMLCDTICGDGIRAGIEECDDANFMGEDGCDPTCGIEFGFTCPPEGGPCVPDVVDVCGDGNLSGTELCDDGNTSSGDGCSAACDAIEPGYSCFVPGLPCQTICGDGQVVGTEMCDDGNALAGDGCDSTCAVEAGYDCPVPGQPCNPI